MLTSPRGSYRDYPLFGPPLWFDVRKGSPPPEVAIEKPDYHNGVENHQGQSSYWNFWLCWGGSAAVPMNAMQIPAWQATLRQLCEFPLVAFHLHAQVREHRFLYIAAPSALPCRSGNSAG